MLGLLLALQVSTWKPVDTGLTLAGTSLLVVDALQSRAMARQGIRETNVVLGPHPKPATVVGYFSGVIVLTWVLPRYLPPTPRRMLLGGLVMVEVVCVTRNYTLGIRF